MEQDIVTTRRSMEDAPLMGFHRFILFCTAGGTFCEGYILGIISIALVQIEPRFELSSLWMGSIGAMSLVGAFLGAMVAGPIADRIGRRRVFTTILIAFVVLSALHFWVADPWSLLVLRLLLGLAIGADFPVSVALLSEFSPKNHRGRLLGMQYLAWGIGYAGSFAVGYVLIESGPDAWRWMLASSALPALITLLLRVRVPESPMWLASRGRISEAQFIVDRNIGPEYEVVERPVDDSPSPRVGVKHMVKSGYGKRLVFVGVFLSAQVTPQFAIGTYGPSVFGSLGIDDEAFATFVSNAFTIVGTLIGMLCVTRWGRRPLLMAGFAISMGVLGVIGVVPQPAVFVIVACFIINTVVSSGAGVLSSVYPAELFPTEFRASALGLTIGASRIASAVGTFLFPVVIDVAGIQVALLLSAGIALAGLVASLLWAEETKGRPLSETGVILAK